MHRVPSVRFAASALVALVVLAAAACALDNHARDGGNLDFVIGGVALRVSSGTARTEGGALALYLTDQPDACLAITQIPTGSSTVFKLVVSAGADGSTAAEVIAASGTPPPGRAVGALSVASGGTITGQRMATSGTVSWTPNPSGSTTIVALDVGFADTADRLSVAGLTVPSCGK